jgi:NADH dehydrogenase FAD-containing subunit
VVLDDGQEIGTENVVWTAGNRPNVKLKDLDLPPLRWTREQVESQGFTWWGGMPPPEYQESTPLNGSWP